MLCFVLLGLSFCVTFFNFLLLFLKELIMTKWNSILSTSAMIASTEKFATGLISANSWYYDAVTYNVGPQVRPLIKVRGAQSARSVARKALRRRNLT